MAETEELGLTTEDQLEALDALENGQEVDASEGGGAGDASLVGSNAVDDPVSFIWSVWQYYWGNPFFYLKYIVICLCIRVTFISLASRLQELEAIKARVREMEEEAEKLKQLQSEVDKQMNLGSPPGIS